MEKNIAPSSQRASRKSRLSAPIAEKAVIAAARHRRAWYVAAMLRSCSRVIALTAMVASPSTVAQPATLTLACQGTATSGVEDAKPEPVSMGIIVNFTKQTVHGFGYPGLDYPVKITAWNDVTITFGGSDDYKASARHRNNDRHRHVGRFRSCATPGCITLIAHIKRSATLYNLLSAYTQQRQKAAPERTEQPPPRI
jgi:hypothetical protein